MTGHLISSFTMTRLPERFGAPKTFVYHECGYTSWVQPQEDGTVLFGPDEGRGWKVFEGCDTWPGDYENYRNVAGNTQIRLRSGPEA